MIQINNHKLLCGDITKGAVDIVMENEKANIIYSDPPWVMGNLKFWDTQLSYPNLRISHIEIRSLLLLSLPFLKMILFSERRFKNT